MNNKNLLIGSFRFVTGFLIIVTILTMVIAPLIGTDKSSFLDLFSSKTGQQIFFELRLPRIVFAFFVSLVAVL